MSSSWRREDTFRAVERVITPANKIEYNPQKPIATRNGGFLLTYNAQHKEWGTVAYKKLKVTFIKESEGNKLKREAAIQRQLHHPSIVTLVGMVFEQGNYGLVLEYMRFGEVKQFVKDYQVFLGWKLQIIYDVALGMNYLHTQKPPIIHGDLTTQNILIGDGFKAKITDFGFSEWKDFSRSLSQDNMESGTVTHVPPENWADPRQKKNEKFDVFGFGIAVWEILTEASSYDESYGAGKICELVQKGDRPNINHLVNKIPPRILNLISRCWQQNASLRPSFSEIKKELDDLWQENQTEIGEAKKYLNEQEQAKQSGQRPTPEIERNKLRSDTKVQPPELTRVHSTLSNEDLRIRVIKNYVAILTDAELKSILDNLFQENIINSDEKEEIQNKANNTNRKTGCRMLLDRLLRKSNPETFTAFSRALEPPHLADRLKNPLDEVDHARNSEGLTNDQIKYKVLDMCRKLISDVDPVDMIDLLFQEEILNLDQKAEIIKKLEINTQECCKALLCFLFFSPSDKAFVVLRKALEDQYSWIVKDIDDSINKK